MDMMTSKELLQCHCLVGNQRIQVITWIMCVVKLKLLVRSKSIYDNLIFDSVSFSNTVN